jgi:hypothetical protein
VVASSRTKIELEIENPIDSIMILVAPEVLWYVFDGALKI